jgi:hypothetical protein
MSIRSQFALWGFFSFACVSTGLAVLVLAAMMQRGVISDFAVGEVLFSRNVPWLIAGPIVLGFALGWIALAFGRRLSCSECGGDVLPPDQAGFRGLRFWPLIHAARGRNICPKCSAP